MKIIKYNPPSPPLSGRKSQLSSPDKGRQEGLQQHPDFISYSSKLKTYARVNRKQQTNAERILWYEVLNGKKLDFKFTRQKPIDRYILDFYCSKLLLGIELDGDSHEGKEEYDNARSKVLEGLNIKIIRFNNNEILTNIADLKKKLINIIATREKEFNPFGVIINRTALPTHPTLP